MYIIDSDDEDDLISYKPESKKRSMSSPSHRSQSPSDESIKSWSEIKKFMLSPNEFETFKAMDDSNLF